MTKEMGFQLFLLAITRITIPEEVEENQASNRCAVHITIRLSITGCHAHSVKQL